MMRKSIVVSGLAASAMAILLGITPTTVEASHWCRRGGYSGCGYSGCGYSGCGYSGCGYSGCGNSCCSYSGYGYYPSYAHLGCGPGCYSSGVPRCATWSGPTTCYFSGNYYGYRAPMMQRPVGYGGQQGYYVPPHPPGSPPSSVDRTPKAYDAPPQPYDPAPKTYDAAPKAYNITPKPDVPPSPDLTPKADVPPKPDVTPTP